MTLPTANGRFFDDLIRFVARCCNGNLAIQTEESVINSPVEDHLLASIGELNARRGTRLAQRRTPPFVVEQATLLQVAPAIEVGVIEFALGAVGSFHQ